MPERSIKAYVLACEAKHLCPIACAEGGGLGVRVVVGGSDALRAIIRAWDGKRTWPSGAWVREPDRHEAIRLALAAGLGPAMDRFLFGEEAARG